ncbi:MAG: TolC family protein, partial [Acidobacteriota bacterium]|nr:TolC family protein [Acidobacteriota bacterium]
GLALAAATTAAAAPQPAARPVALTLDDAIARGLATSHQLAALDAQHDAAQAAVSSEQASRRPIVSLQAGYQRTNHIDAFGLTVPGRGFLTIYPDVPDTYRTRLDLQWPIYTGGRQDALERAARAEAGADAEQVATARADLRLEITRAYWALVTAGDAVTVVEQAHAQMLAHLEDVRHRFAVGLLPPNDVSAAEAQEARDRMLLIQARNQRDIAATALRRLIGLAPETPVVPQARLEPPAPVPPVATLIADARAHRSERRALEARMAAAGDRETAAGAGRRPTVALEGGVDYARPNPRIFPRVSEWNESWDVGVNVNWSLWDGGRTGAAVAQASAGVRAAREQLADFDTALDADVRERALDLQSSEAAIPAADEAVRAAEDARRVVENRFEAGVATSTDVLDAQVALLQAELDRTQAVAAARLAEARLDRVLGR